MARFCTLCSGSSGNSAYISGSDTAVLVDAGKSCKQLLAAMEAKKIDPKALRGILVTHEHTDHVSGLKTLVKRLKIPVYGSQEVLEKLTYGKILEPQTEMVPVTPGQPLEIGSLRVEVFDTPHDSIHSVGYKFHTMDGRTLMIATDLGYVTEEIRQRMTGCDLVLLEANYDQRMLGASSYPYYLKQRIASNQGHLSNESCAAELVGLVRAGTTRLMLGHLSQHNNLPQLAYQTAYAALAMDGLRENLDFTLKVAPREEPGEMVVL